MRRIGIVASGASETGARVVLNEGEKKAVKVEDLVLIKNRNGNDVFAVCRGGLGSNDNLKTGAYSPGVAYARMGRKPSHAKEFFEFKLSVIGDITTGLMQNKRIIAPCSDVYVFEEKDNPMGYLGPNSITIGYYKEHPSWSVPIDPKFIPYHTGVFLVSIDYNDPIIYEEKSCVRVEKIGDFVDRFYEEGDDGHPIFVKGVKVPCFSPQNLKVAWRPVQYVLRHRYQGPMYRLTLQGDKAVTITPAHSVFTIREGRVREEKWRTWR